MSYMSNRTVLEKAGLHRERFLKKFLDPDDPVLERFADIAIVTDNLCTAIESEINDNKTKIENINTRLNLLKKELTFLFLP